MITIAYLSKRMYGMLTDRADELGRETGFVQRRSKVTGAKFSQAIVLGWLAKPDASLNDLSQTAAGLGIRLSPQGLDNRFGPASAELMKRLLVEAAQQVVESQPRGKQKL